MKKSIYIILFLFIFSFTHLDAYTFVRDLKIGSTGEDVRELQKILNKNPLTQVSQKGPGSPGNESDFFGQKTQDAVIKFQELNFKELSKSIKALEEREYVGQITRDLLHTIQKETLLTSTDTNLISENIATSTSIIVSTSTTFHLPKDPNKESAIFFISEDKIQAGVYKKKSGFRGRRRILVDNKVYVGSHENIKKDVTFFMNSKKMKKKCFSDYACVLSINHKTPPGVYKITSNNPDWGFREIKIIDQSIEPPQINIKSLSLTNDNLIKGKHFTQNMKVYTMFGVFKTETENDSFILRFPDEYTKYTTTTIPGMFYIENNVGLKSNIVRITYEK